MPDENNVYDEIELRDDERICPYCKCVNNMINNTCLECKKPLSDKEILKHISENDTELMPMLKNINKAIRIELLLRLLIIGMITACTVVVAKEPTGIQPMVFIAITGGLLAVYGMVVLYKNHQQKKMNKAAEDKVIRYKQEHGFFADKACP